MVSFPIVFALWQQDGEVCTAQRAAHLTASGRDERREDHVEPMEFGTSDSLSHT